MLHWAAPDSLSLVESHSGYSSPVRNGNVLTNKLHTHFFRQINTADPQIVSPANVCLEAIFSDLHFCVVESEQLTHLFMISYSASSS